MVPHPRMPVARGHHKILLTFPCMAKAEVSNERMLYFLDLLDGDEKCYNCELLQLEKHKSNTT